MKITLYIDTTDEKKFIQALEELCGKYAKATEERTPEGILQERSKHGRAWFFKVVKEE